MKRVLAIDGGGIRGLLPASLLVALEQREGKPAGSQFDLLAGTSTGGIIAAGLAAGTPAKDILWLYQEHGPAIFQRRWLYLLDPFIHARYSAAALESALKRVLGARRLGAPDLKAELLVPTYAVQLPFPIDLDGDGVEECASSFFFKSWKAREKPLYDFELWRVARATSAAPTFFPAAKISNVLGNLFIMVDGGVFANNPALCAWAAAKQLWPGEAIQVVSLGTGTRVRAVEAGNWGSGPWLRHIFSVFMDGSADSVSYVCREILGAEFIRCEMALPDGFDEAFDHASPSHIEALRDLAAGYTDKFLGIIPRPGN